MFPSDLRRADLWISFFLSVPAFPVSDEGLAEDEDAHVDEQESHAGGSGIDQDDADLGGAGRCSIGGLHAAVEEDRGHNHGDAQADSCLGDEASHATFPSCPSHIRGPWRSIRQGGSR